jgi:hypothetical protein
LPEAAEMQESAVYRRIVGEVRRMGLTTVEIADITGVGERQVQNWVSGNSRPAGKNRDLLLEIHYIVDGLKDVYTPEGVEVWLHGRNRVLGSRRPIELLKEGEFEIVLDEVERLNRGGG